MVVADKAKEIGPAPLAPANIGTVINEARELWLANIATQRLDSIGALEGYSVNKRRFSTLLP